jgi:hypothetical protein
VSGSYGHLAGVVKSNSSGIEVWRGSLIQASSRSRRVLDRGVVEALNPPQHGLGVTGKSSTPREKFLSRARLFLYSFNSCNLLEHFTILEFELLLVILGTSLVIGVSRNRGSLVLLIKFA